MVEDAIEDAMLVTIEAGLDFGKDNIKNSIPYVRILQSSLETAAEFYQKTKQSRGNTDLVNLLEIHALVGWFDFAYN